MQASDQGWDGTGREKSRLDKCVCSFFCLLGDARRTHLAVKLHQHLGMTDSRLMMPDVRKNVLRVLLSGFDSPEIVSFITPGMRKVFLGLLAEQFYLSEPINPNTCYKACHESHPNHSALYPVDALNISCCPRQAGCHAPTCTPGHAVHHTVISNWEAHSRYVHSKVGSCILCFSLWLVFHFGDLIGESS